MNTQLMKGSPGTPRGGNINSPRQHVPNQSEQMYFSQSQIINNSNQTNMHQGNQNNNASRRYNNQNRYQAPSRHGSVPMHVSNQQYDLNLGSFSPAHRQSGQTGPRGYHGNSPQGYIPRHQQLQGPQQVFMPTYVSTPLFIGLSGVNTTGYHTNMYMPFPHSTSSYTGFNSKHESMAAFPFIQQNGYRPGSGHPINGVLPQGIFGPHPQTYPTWALGPPLQTQLPSAFENTDSSLNSQENVPTVEQTSSEMSNKLFGEMKVGDQVEASSAPCISKDDRYQFYICL